jgi:hypothetical protein
MSFPINGLQCKACKKMKSQTSFERYMYEFSSYPVCNDCKPNLKQNLNLDYRTVFERKCLGCDKQFKTKNKFIRRCKGCKSWNNCTMEEWYGGVEKL